MKQTMNPTMLRIATAMLIASSVPSFASSAHAEEKGASENQWSLSTIASDHEASAAFDEMRKGHPLPAWVTQDVAESPAQSIDFDGEPTYVMTACKPHDCGAHRIAVMYIPAKKVMYGVLLESHPKISARGILADTETLTWLNIGGGNESIDGKTILYAALTGSLENHRGQFNFK